MYFKLILFYYYIKYKFFVKISNRKRLEAFQRKKIRKHLKYVTENSKFYSEYEGKELSEFPLTDKKIIMENFDTMNTVGINKEKAYEIAINSEKSRDFKMKYNNIVVGLSSGTSGNRGLFIASDFERAKWAGIILAKLLPKVIIKKQKIALFLRADSELYNTVKSKVLKFKFFDMILDFDENIKELNKYKPDVLIAPASILKILALNTEKLDISPVKIFSCAEVLTVEDKNIITEKFKMPIHEIYQATEGFIGYSDKNGDFIKINEDILFIEKEYIDNENKRFIPIITDFERKSQPIIRYRLNDIWIENKTENGVFLMLDKIEGREDDIFLFQGTDGIEVRIFPDFIRRVIMLNGEEILEYRIFQKDRFNINVSYILKDKADNSAVKKKIVNGLYDLLYENGVAETEKININFIEYVNESKLNKNRRIKREF